MECSRQENLTEGSIVGVIDVNRSVPVEAGKKDSLAEKFSAACIEEKPLLFVLQLDWNDIGTLTVDLVLENRTCIFNVANLVRPQNVDSIEDI